RQLEVFWTVARELSFTRAAERLLTAQSAVSAQVRSLERELGVELFDRSRRRIRLTPAGAALVPRARETMDALQAVRDSAAELRDALTGSVTVGLMTSVTIVDVPALIGRFHALHPGVRVRLRAAQRGTAGLVDDLATAEIDLAFLALAGVIPRSLRATALASSPIRLLVPPQHRLSGRAAVGLADLEDDDFIDVPDGYGARRIVDEGFAAAGVDRQVLIEVADIGTVAQYVQQGLGVALLPEFVVDGSAAGVRTLPLRESLPDFTVYLARSPDRKPSAAAEAFAQVVLAST
ncbi:MAG TPA: LysR family transcriptional regulator, partial [Lacisediminihabitans sp.]|uniref:LysR family transcriptional regulator n=1 Tax=Lacisediminihabitans sp. TaxID=2787631 RepID=UPI002EDADF4D